MAIVLTKQELKIGQNIGVGAEGLIEQRRDPIFGQALFQRVPDTKRQRTPFLNTDLHADADDAEEPDEEFDPETDPELHPPTAEQRKIEAGMGISHEEFLKTRKKARK